MAVRRGTRALIGVLVVVVLLIVAFVVADVALRSYAEGQIKAQLTDSLPEGTTADSTVTIGGASFIAQYLAGSFGTVTVDAPRLTVDGTELAARIVATGVPTDQSKPVTKLTGTVSLDQDALQRIVSDAEAGSDSGTDSAVKLGDGTLSYEGHVSFLGIDIGYTASAKPVAKGTTVDLVPTAVDVTSGPVAIDVKSLLGDLAAQPIPICVAQYLPPQVLVTGVNVSPERATATLEAKNVVLDQLNFDAPGSC